VDLATVAEQVHRELRSLILRGEFRPGTQLAQRPLAKRLGVSPTPVVEALRWLERDGLVVRVPKWGAFVKQWTPEEVREAFLLRRLLECEAVPLFMRHAKADDRQRLRELNETFNSLSAAGDGATAAVVDHDLHAQVLRGAHLPFFERALERSMAAILTISAAHRFLTSETTAGEVGLHDEVVEALLGEDVGRAQRLVREHIEDAMAKFDRRMARLAAEPNQMRPIAAVS
jgi:DNA-binding GntR family transcriptional regulator